MVCEDGVPFGWRGSKKPLCPQSSVFLDFLAVGMATNNSGAIGRVDEILTTACRASNKGARQDIGELEPRPQIWRREQTVKASAEPSMAIVDAGRQDLVEVR